MAAENRTVEQTAPDAEFVEQFVKAQRRLYLFILAQVPSPQVAEEILQNANLVIWSKYRQFQPGTNFLAWCFQIAQYEILKERTRTRRERLLFSSEFLETISRELHECVEDLEQRRLALQECLQKLKPRDRQLIEQRYAPGESGRQLAEKLGRPSNSVYQSLGRIRRALWECIRRRLAAGASPS
ncbi:MAG: DNA-directed RNA polymerase sigma-70 factor [Planctomycetaceae bacterium]|nr:MAG: DNA-directed RNA polymerase sigma-70 factor [Planctomycetaceae bacterium]